VAFLFLFPGPAGLVRLSSEAPANPFSPPFLPCGLCFVFVRWVFGFGFLVTSMSTSFSFFPPLSGFVLLFLTGSNCRPGFFDEVVPLFFSYLSTRRFEEFRNSCSAAVVSPPGGVKYVSRFKGSSSRKSTPSQHRFGRPAPR